jgi:hypothetical protein
VTTEIYYMLCFDTKTKKWYAADNMLGNLLKNQGPVLEGEGSEGKFRPIAEGLEADMDYENIEKLGQFIRSNNEES